jgi:hypothetical protein
MLEAGVMVIGLIYTLSRRWWRTCFTRLLDPRIRLHPGSE